MPPNVPDHRPSLQGHRLWSGLSILSKRSFRSFTTSNFEADDERSQSSSADADMSDPSSRDDPVRPLPPPLYLGQDSRPTSRKELMGWYAYAFAAETYIICGIASFIPILLESLARENGVLLSDPTKPCGASDDKKSSGDGQCVVYVLGIEINTASFAMYTFSISVLLQAVLVVSISCAADHGNYRKKLLLAFAWIGSASVMSYIFISKETYILGALLTIISNTSFGASFVLLNSFLPLLVRNHPEVIAARESVTPDFGESDLESRPLEVSPPDSDSNLENSTSGLLANDRLRDNFSSSSNGRHLAKDEDLTSKELHLSTQISAKGIGIGYSAGLFVQCIGIGILILYNNTTWSQRIALFVVGLWWTIFTIPAALWLRPRPGPPLADQGKGRFAWLQYFIFAWKSIFKTFMVARRLLDVMLFLASWFLLSDAIATTSSTAILFAKTTLHMKPAALVMISVISTTFGVLGAFGWSYVSRAFGLKPHQTILVCIGMFELIPLYGLLGYLPFVRNWGVGGLQQAWEMYPLAAVYGLVLGGLSSYCRSLFGELIPPGSEAAFYALYAITDKGSSVFGPAIVGAIIDRTGNIRPAFWFLAILVGMPAPIIWFVNVERGKREGEKLAGGVGVEVAHEASDAQYERETRGMLADYD